MTTATVSAKPTTRPDSITLDSWNNILFLVQEPDRHGSTVWNVRLCLGDLPPWQYGLFETKIAARETFFTLVTFVDGELEVLFCNAGNRAGCESNEEY